MNHDVTISLPAVQMPVRYISFPDVYAVAACLQMYLESGYTTDFSTDDRLADTYEIRNAFGTDFLLAVSRNHIAHARRQYVPDSLILPFSKWFKYQITALLSNRGTELVLATRNAVERGD